MRVLAAFAHPDDETILIGGTLAMLADLGLEVVILSATRGEGGELGEPPITTAERLGEIREAELRCAAKALGAREVRFMGYRDPPVGEDGEGLEFTADREQLVSRMVEEIERTGASIVITHGVNGEYGHPAHISMYAVTREAMKSMGDRAPMLYSVSAIHADHPRPRLANQDQSADLVIDIGPWFSAKLAAAQCHRTQNALFVRRSSELAGRALELEEVLMRTESLHHGGAIDGDPSRDVLARFISGRWGEALLYWRGRER